MNSPEKTQKRKRGQICINEGHPSKRVKNKPENGQTISQSDERESDSTVGARSSAHKSERSYALQAWLNEKPDAGPWSSETYQAKAAGEKSA